MTINCRGRLVSFDTPKIMGIVNITDDSFYSDSRFKIGDHLLNHISKMVDHGAHILDIGAMSSRPGASIISADQELNKLVPIVKLISEKFPELLLSIDTIHSKVVSELSKLPIHIINDISGGTFDSDMYQTCAEHQLAYVMMHMKGTPDHMQDAPSYEDLMVELLTFFRNRIILAQSKGLNSIVIDPGFGFGKTIEHNYSILKNLNSFRILDHPILVGLSRKSMIYKVLDTDPQNALNGTTAANMIALMNGAKILRVHDVKEARETISIWEKISSNH